MAYTFEVTEESVGQRVDVLIAAQIDDVSRNQLKYVLKAGGISVNSEPLKALSRKVKQGDIIHVVMPEVIESSLPQSEDIPLNIVYEDDDLLVINKQAGLIVHPGAGNHNGTLVNALLAHCGDSLSGIGGVSRPGIVHRLDKDTSGLMVVAKHDQAHRGLAEQLEKRTLKRVYHAIVWGNMTSERTGTIKTQIGRSPRNRLKMAVMDEGGKEAVTHYKVLKHYMNKVDWVECQLETGRTHQIRVHMAHMGHGLVADPLYGQGKKGGRKIKKFFASEERYQAFETYLSDFNRQALHAKELSFVHPVKNENMSFSTNLPEDMEYLLNHLSEKD